MDEMTGGTFTISNGGVFGSLLSTPIINPPQSAVLGMHRIEERPVVKDGQIVARPMMYLALSYDHRMIDGREAVTFLVRVKEAIEDPTRLADRPLIPETFAPARSCVVRLCRWTGPERLVSWRRSRWRSGGG